MSVFTGRFLCRNGCLCGSGIRYLLPRLRSFILTFQHAALNRYLPAMLKVIRLSRYCYSTCLRFYRDFPDFLFHHRILHNRCRYFLPMRGTAVATTVGRGRTVAVIATALLSKVRAIVSIRAVRAIKSALLLRPVLLLRSVLPLRPVLTMRPVLPLGPVLPLESILSVGSILLRCPFVAVPPFVARPVVAVGSLRLTDRFLFPFKILSGPFLVALSVAEPQIDLP